MEWFVLLVCLALITFFFARRPKKLSMAHLPERFVVFDFETIGLDPAADEIIEIGAIRFNRDSTRHQAFQCLIKPTKKVSKRITELTGITQAMLDSDGRPLAETLPEFVDFIGELPLVSFNAPFDMAFFRAAAARHGVNITNPVSCALKMARRAWPGRKSYRLSDIAKDGKLNCVNAHRALADCERTVHVYIAAASRLKSAT